MRERLVLGIESSCDETAAAVVRGGVTVLSNVVASQTELHARYRGVVPEIASRSHMQRILPTVQEALTVAGVGVADLDGIAVTNRPGMIGCLLVGITAAKTLSWRFGIPLLAVDHVQAHIHAAFMTRPDLPLPLLALIASGGHTALYLVKEQGAAERLGATRDDAAGEALDKGAALLGLPYPGGPAIQATARSGDPAAVPLPRSLLGPDSLDFSFSGVKTALLYHLRGAGGAGPTPTLATAALANLAASYQAAIVDVLVTKLARAAKRFPVRSLAIGGGVARNELLRARLGADPAFAGLALIFPPLDLCADNGAMVAGVGDLLLGRGEVADLSLPAAATAAATSRAPRPR